MEDLFERSLRLVEKDGTFSGENRRVFFDLYRRFVLQKELFADWKSIRPIDFEEIPKAADLPMPEKEESRRLLSRLAVCKLNGGLGTGMGCRGAKSAIPVKDGKTFLDLTMEQMETLNGEFECDVPLILMNSFHTDAQTRRIVKKYANLQILPFRQSSIYRLDGKTLLPIIEPNPKDENKSPPGHGDFYSVREFRRLVGQLLKQGKKHLFVSNADNLFGTSNLTILKRLADSGTPFLLEVTKKTPHDAKGGSFVRKKNGRIALLELAQVPPEKRPRFNDPRIFSNFNTNNLWFDLEKLETYLDKEKRFRVMANPKTVGGRPVIQLETAIGSAIEEFDGASLLQVERDRFLPVKSTDDLFLLQSNLFSIQNGFPVPNPSRKNKTLPRISLGESLKFYEQYAERLKEMPNVLELESLTVEGDVGFGRNVRLVGKVVLRGVEKTFFVPDDSLIRNQTLGK